MTGEAVLIAAYSGRALAQSARRSGYLPLVVDAFGDDDTREAAALYEQMPEGLRGGFRLTALMEALEALAQKSQSKTIGLVVGSGFEDRPRLLQKLDDRFGLIGTRARSVEHIKNPIRFADLCRRLSIPHPETTTDRPAQSNGWLTKQTGGTGGGHIHHDLATPQSQSHYFQRELGGTSRSLFAIVSSTMTYTSPTRQWCIETPGRPFRYGGAVCETPGDSVLQQMNEAANKIIDEISLRGIVSFDFRIVDETAYLLEVNPRPGATLDLFDSDDHPLFQSHIDAANDTFFKVPRVPDGAPLAALLYADRATTFPNLTWPEWAADRTPAGTPIKPGQPLATIFARGPTADAAEALARERLASLRDLIYGHQKS